MWRSSDGALCRTLQGHGHWVNVLALNTDYVTRTAAFEPQEARLVHGEADPATEAEGRDRAAKRWVGKCNTGVRGNSGACIVGLAQMTTLGY